MKIKPISIVKRIDNSMLKNAEMASVEKHPLIEESVVVENVIDSEVFSCEELEELHKQDLAQQAYREENIMNPDEYSCSQLDSMFKELNYEEVSCEKSVYTSDALHPFFDIKAKQLDTEEIEDMDIRREHLKTGIVIRLPKNLNITRPSKTLNREKPLFFSGDITFAEFKGKQIALFEGRLEILEKKVKIIEQYSALGKAVGKSELIYFKVKLTLDGYACIKEIGIEELFKGNFITEMSHGMSTLSDEKEAKKIFKEYVKQLCAQGAYKTTLVYATGGWKNINDRWLYVTPAGVVGEPNMEIYADTGKTFIVCKNKNRTEVTKTFLGMRGIFKRNHEVGIMFQYFLILAILKTLFRECGIGVQFMLYICGETNTKKTSLAQVFFKIFNRDHKVDVDFTSTAVALLEEMEENADAVTVFDDVVPPRNKTAEKELMNKLELLVRGYGGNLPRKVAKRFVQMNPGMSQFSPVLSLGVVTGEVFPVTLKSSKSRIVKVELASHDCDEEKLSWYQNHMESLPTFVQEFLDYVTKNQKTIIPLIQNCFKNEQRRRSLSLKVPRYNEVYAHIVAATEVFKQYLYSLYSFESEEIESLILKDQVAIAKILIDNDNEATLRSNEEIICEAIMTTLISQKSNNKEIECLDRVEEYGEHIAIYQQNLPKILKAYYSGIGLVFPFYSTNDLSKFLASKGLILVKNDSNQIRYAHKVKKLHGLNNRAYLFYSEKVKALNA